VTAAPRAVAGLLELATAFERSQTLQALIAFAVPNLLSERSRTGSDLAQAMGLHAAAADRLLAAGVALGLIAQNGRRFANTPIAERFLVRGRSAYLGDALLHHARSPAQRWARLPARLRAWRPRPGRRAPHRAAAHVVADLEAQHPLACFAGDALAHAHDFSRHRRLLDLGGGSGAMAIALCRRYPRLRATVLDLPPVARLARRHVRQSRLASRIAVRAADLFADPLPERFDLALLANVLSIASESAERALLVRLHERLAPGGTLVISGWILDDDRRSPLLAVLFCLDDVASGAFDTERAAGTYARWLRAAGFASVKRLRFAPPWSALIARKGR